MNKLFVITILSLSISIVFANALNKPTIIIFATGGTIAGTATSQTSTTYQSGKLSVKELISSVKGLTNLATIKYKQIFNKDSNDLNQSDWLILSSEVMKAANDPAINAIVITHGTDTLEETAYFLELVTKTNKPIILVGSMRPATSMSADGPLNLYNAVAVAANHEAAKRGVLVVMNEQIFDARSVQKTNTTSIQAFQAPNSGPVGYVFMGNVRFNSKNLRTNSKKTIFNVTNVCNLPDVAIIYEYAGINAEMLNHILNTKNLKGIVIAGTGDGNIPNHVKPFIEKARNMGIIIVRSSRAGSGEVSYDCNNLDSTYGLIAGNNLNPAKARILLMLSLMNSNKINEIQKNFYTH